MPTNLILGELEQLVLLAILRKPNEAYAINIREELALHIGKDVSRGALYRTLDRLEGKGYLRWTLDEDIPDRGGHPRRSFHLTPDGVTALQRSRKVLTGMWTGLEEVLQ